MLLLTYKMGLLHLEYLQLQTLSHTALDQWGHSNLKPNISRLWSWASTSAVAEFVLGCFLELETSMKTHLHVSVYLCAWTSIAYGADLLIQYWKGVLVVTFSGFVTILECCELAVPFPCQHMPKGSNGIAYDGWVSWFFASSHGLTIPSDINLRWGSGSVVFFVLFAIASKVLQYPIRRRLLTPCNLP